MKAVLFGDKLDFVEDHPLPEPRENEALIRVSLAGICNTDLEIMKGYSGFRGVIGHEFVGVVEETNGSDRGLTGRRVVGEINCGCGRCSYCLRGLKNHCPHRRVLGILGKDGAMAEYITLPVENLLEVPEGIADEEAVFTEPLAAAFGITSRVHVRPTDRVLVMGDGKLGLLCCLVLKLLQSDMTLVGRHEDKLRVARRLNIKAVLLDDIEMVRDYDTVIEATGSAGGLETALRLVRPQGTVVLKSTVAGGRELNLSSLVVDEITVAGSRCGPFGPALRALAGRDIDVRPLITGVFPFERAEEAFKRAEEPGSLKVMIDFRQGVSQGV